MIYELNPNDYDQARPIFQGMDCNLAVRTVLDGVVPGTIYVDDPIHPTAALTRVKHRFFLAGDAGNDAFNRALQEFFDTKVYPQSLAAGVYALVLYFAPDEWQDPINGVILKEKFPIKSRRQFYGTDKLKEDWRAIVPQGYALRRIDRDLLKDSGLRGRDMMIEELLSERYSVEQFFTQNFGFCVLHGNQIVGLCLSEHNVGNRCEVGIQTMLGHRRKGLATAMSLALIEHALANGITQVGWHCYADNVGSIATARKVGFEKVTDYSTYYACFKEADNLAENGYRRFQQERYQKAITWWEKAFRTGDAPTWAYLMTARVWAALGNHDAAFKHLNETLTRGWTNASAIADAKEFEPLHDTPLWQALLARLEEIDHD